MNTNYIGLLMYDISVENEKQRKEYTNFRKRLLKTGYYQLQESVYICRYKYKDKMTNDLSLFKEIAPKNSNIRFILLTKQQFSSIEVISGEKSFIEKILTEKNYIVEL